MAYVKYNLVQDLGFVGTGVSEYPNKKKYFSTGSVKCNVFIPEGDYEFSTRPSRANREVVEGDVLQARMQNTDKIVIIDKNLHGNLFSTGFFQFRPPKEVVLSKYLYYFLSSEAFLRRKDELCEGSTQKAISDKNLKKIDIFLPPLDEQRRVVAKLDTLFAPVAEALRINAGNIEFAKNLLIKKRDEILSQENSTYENWQYSKLENLILAKPKNGKSPPRELQSDEGTRLLTLSSVTGNSFDLSKSIFTKAAVDEGAEYWIENGDLLITRANTRELVGHVAIVEGVDEPTMYPDLIMKMKVNNSTISTKFLHQYLMTSKTRKIIMASAKGANPTMVKINQEVVKSIPVEFPSTLAQGEIVSRLERIEEQIQKLKSAYSQKQQNLARLKSAILAQELQSEAA